MGKNDHHRGKGIKILDPRTLTTLSQVKMLSTSNHLHILMKKVLILQKNQTKKIRTSTDCDMILQRLRT
jgi:hypothetical protein